MRSPSPHSDVTWLWIPCLVLLLSCRAFADNNVIGESREGSPNAATPSKASPDNAPRDKLESEIAALQERLKHQKEIKQSLDELHEKSSKTDATPASSPRPETVQTSKKNAVSGWAGTWTGELVCIGSPKGQEGRTGTFIVKIDQDERRGCSYQVNTKPLPSRVKVSGEKAVLVGITEMPEGSMQVTVVMDRTSRNQASVTARILMKESGVTAALTGEMERR